MLVLYIIYVTSGLLLTKAIISKSIVLEVILNDKYEKKTFKKTIILKFFEHFFIFKSFVLKNKRKRKKNSFKTKMINLISKL